MTRFRQSIVIAADANRIWPFVADPELQRRWDSEILAVIRKQSGPVTPGERFEIEYREDKRTQVTVQVSEAPYQVTYEHRMLWKGREQCALHTFQLSPCRTGVRVVQSADLIQLGIPWPWRFLIWLISIFGRPVGNSLEKLKQTVENPRKNDSAKQPG